MTYTENQKIIEKEKDFQTQVRLNMRNSNFAFA